MFFPIQRPPPSSCFATAAREAAADVLAGPADYVLASWQAYEAGTEESFVERRSRDVRGLSAPQAVVDATRAPGGTADIGTFGEGKHGENC